MRLLPALAILSAAVISYQLVLMQLLSIIQWYHFAYMVISIALLGFGVAGTIISLFRKALLSKTAFLLPALMMATGLLMATVVSISQSPVIRFDSYLLFVDYSQTVKLLLTYMLLSLPFLTAALAIGITFVKYADRIGKLYFANLLGSGLGGLLAVALSWVFIPQQLPALLALLPMLAALWVLDRPFTFRWLAAFVINLVVIVACILRPFSFNLSQFKGLSKTLNLPGAEIVHEQNSPYGYLQVVSSPVLRHAPGLSLSYPRTVPVQKAIFKNGDWYGTVAPHFLPGDTSVYDYMTRALPYVIRHRTRALVLNAGSGEDVAMVKSRATASIVAVEPNGGVISLLQNELADETVTLPEGVELYMHQEDPRTFLLKDTARYDLITIPTIGAFGGSTGLNALSEQYLLTKDAFGEMWKKLLPEGVISINCWMDYPVRNPLKILATLIEVLTESGVEHPEAHIGAVRNWGTMTIIAKKTPITTAEASRVRSFCHQMLFDPVLLPDISKNERAQYNMLQDNDFFQYIDTLFSSQRQTLYQNYDFNIKPPTDDQPYFSQYIRGKSLPHLSQLFGNNAIAFFEVGYLMVIITLVQVTLISLLLIVAPLFRLGWQGGQRRGVLLYFGGIGIGYMFVEIVFIQRFILYLGNPIYAVAALMCALLVFSGLGSYYTSRLDTDKFGFSRVFLVIMGLLLIYSFFLTPVLQQTIGLSNFWKVLIMTVVIAPLAFVMGLPFPLGLRRLSVLNPQLVPWSWAINGCASVISTALATVIAVELGFKWLTVLAALAYGLPLIATITSKK